MSSSYNLLELLNMPIDIQNIQDSQTPPPLFERGAPMWHDPYIAKQMLDYHLDSSHDIASRSPKRIEETINWIWKQLNLSAGMSLLDLGCGPGLYTSRFAKRGLQVVGIDYSQNSIDYARQSDPVSTYLCQDYTSLNVMEQQFDVITMIYGDFCVLSDSERDQLLATIRDLLKPNGSFVFDVTTPQVHAYLHNYRHWSVAPQGGFWKPAPYVVLEQGFTYPDDVYLQQYVVLEDSGLQTIYRNWYHDYTPSTLTDMLKHNEYSNFEIYGGLDSSDFVDNSDWCAVILQR